MAKTERDDVILASQRAVMGAFQSDVEDDRYERRLKTSHDPLTRLLQQEAAHDADGPLFSDDEYAALAAKHGWVLS